MGSGLESHVQEQSITLTFGMLPGLSLKDFSRVVKRKGVKLYPVGSKGFGNIFTGVQLPPKEDLGSLIAAKWTSFLHHVANKHTEHPNPLYTKCNHGELEQRKWIKIGTAAYQKLHGLLTNKTLVNDIKKLSSDAQTSC